MTDEPAQRLDQALVVRGLARSRALAQALVREGRVRVDGIAAGKPSLRVHEDQDLAVCGAPEAWVGRAAYKLLAALDTFEPIRPAGLRCIDVGASTGGFTQVLLSRGAVHVEAIDVGHGQLAAALRDDRRVTDRPGLSIRDVTVPGSGADGVAMVPAGLVVTDLSFISLTLVMDRLAALTRPDGHLVALVKPQFEVGRAGVGRGGLVRSPRLRADALRAVLEAVTASGMYVHGMLRSPVQGSSGNQEYLLWARHAADGKMRHVDAFLRSVLGEEPA